MFICRILLLDSCLGLAIDRCYGSKCTPLTNYHFWPKNEAWDQIRLEIESKPWITTGEKIKILNKTSEIFNYWQKGELQLSGSNYDFKIQIDNSGVQLAGHL